MADGNEEGSSSTSASTTTTIDLIRDPAAVVDLTGKVHQLPCCIKYDGPTDVSHYFKPKSTEMEVDGLKVEEAYFRGRKLQGTTIALPQGYSGFVLGKKNGEEKMNGDGTSSECCWKTSASFQNMTVWNHDAVPTKDDTFVRAFHWFAVADTLHQPVSAEDLESSSVD